MEANLPHAGTQELEKSLLIFSDPTFINTNVNLSVSIYLILLQNAHFKKMQAEKIYLSAFSQLQIGLNWSVLIT